MNQAVTENREARETAAAFDLLEHPGFADVLKDVAREAKAARRVLFIETVSDREAAHARGTLNVLKSLVYAVYRRANREVPDNIEALFQ